MSRTTERRGRRRAGKVAVAAAVLLSAAAATAAATGVDLDLTGNGDRGPAHSGLPPATAKVARQTLVDAQTETGELGYGDTTTVATRLAGTVTTLPVTGSTLTRGKALYRLDNTPVVLLYGALPAYRALAPGMKGADVKQFEQNLAALGYTGLTVDDSYTAGTAAVVRKWQQKLGLPKTGIAEWGRVFYAAGPVRVDSQTAAIGDALAPGQEVLALTGSQRVVTVELDVADQRLARNGAAVSVTLPDGSTVAGTIARTATFIDPGDDSGGGASDPVTKLRVTVTVADKKALAGLDQASVRVAFTASQREDVLTVPVAALLALAEGGYGVQVVDGATTRIVAVQTGLFSGGRVEVSGDGLTDGMTVGTPS